MDDLVAGLPRTCDLVELGSGAAQKTRWFVEALLRQQGNLRYVPIDVSHSALVESGQALRADHETLDVLGLCATYEAGLNHWLGTLGPPLLLLWLGSNLGNLNRRAAHAELASLARRLRQEDRLVLGLDLIKPPAVLERAYDDGAGVTARFNLNLLARINRELGGHFLLDSFRHSARWEADLARIEMHLVSTRDQRVRIEALGREFSFHAGETIHTESSHKYDPATLPAWLETAGWTIQKRWVDPYRGFADYLLAPRPL